MKALRLLLVVFAGVVLASPVHSDGFIEVFGVMAVRERDRIVIKGSLTNTMKETNNDGLYTYAIHRWNGKDWVVLKSGKVAPLAPGKFELVFVEIPMSVEEQRYNVTVSWKNRFHAKEVILPAGKPKPPAPPDPKKAAVIKLISLDLEIEGALDRTLELRCYTNRSNTEVFKARIPTKLARNTFKLNKGPWNFEKGMTLQVWEIHDGLFQTDQMVSSIDFNPALLASGIHNDKFMGRGKRPASYQFKLQYRIDK